MTFCCIITPIFGIIIITLLWKIFKKSGENKNKLKTVYPKNHENVQNSKPGSNFTGSYKKSDCIRRRSCT